MAELTDEEIYRVAVSNAGTSIGKDIGKAERSLDRFEDGLGAGINSRFMELIIVLLTPEASSCVECENDCVDGAGHRWE
jgi:hypothetical protein